MAEQDTKINIDDKEYLLSELSDDAKAQIQSLQFVDAEVARLNAKMAIANTARMAYTNKLKTLLPE